MKLERHKQLVPTLPDNTSIKLIGLGGTGSIVARYLGIFLAAQKTPSRMVFIDGDKFEPSNSSRMMFGDCGNKAAVIHKELMARFFESRLTLDCIEEYVTPENIGNLIHPGDIVLLAVDNHATRKLVNDHCAGLSDVTLISGGNDGVEKHLRGTYGNVQIYVRKDGQDATPSLSRFHPEIAKPTDKNPADLSCTELLVSVPQILFANLAVASAMLNTFWLHLCGVTHYSELAFDIADGLMRPIALPTKPAQNERVK